MNSANAIDTYPHATVPQWAPDLPDGAISHLYLHWSAHTYTDVFPAYHFCIAGDDEGALLVVNTHDIGENMRDVRGEPERPYAAHTRGRNSHAIGLSIMGMEGATPQDFGRFPLTPARIDALCLVAARVAKFYGVRIDAEHIMTHAEAGLLEGYFGTEPQQRWDIARLMPRPEPLSPQDALDAGNELRRRIRVHLG
ncbi:MAG: hypothetical protein NVS1B14_11330 [Vulcanimicrobiaceae bacterium]